MKKKTIQKIRIITKYLTFVFLENFIVVYFTTNEVKLIIKFIINGM